MDSISHCAVNRMPCRMHDTLRSRALLVLALAAGALVGVEGNASAFSPDPTPISQGVVRVVNRLGKECSIGSGTLIGRQQDMGVVLTCAHLFSDGVGDLIVFFDGATPRHALPIAIDKKNDLASLVVKHPPAASVPLAAAVPVPGSPLASCGFGPQGNFLVNRGQYLGPVTLKDGEDSGVLEIEGVARQGDSGGPIFDERRRLVAVIFGSNGEVVDGTHCGVIRRFLASNPVTSDMTRRMTRLASRPVDETFLLFRGELTEPSDVPVEPPSLVTVRGVVRYGKQAASGATIHVTGPTARVATLDHDGRFVVEVVAGGSYELTVDAVVHNRLRHGQRSIWVSDEMAQREIELKLD